jgi:hypothetical protein
MSESRKISAVDSRKTLGRAKPDVMMPVPDTLAGMPEGYSVLLSGIKEIITRERIKAVGSVLGSSQPLCRPFHAAFFGLFGARYRASPAVQHAAKSRVPTEELLVVISM